MNSYPLLFLALVSLFVYTNAHRNVKILNDANFEHDTQAATGATTGTWMVLFYSPSCQHCRTVLPTWEVLAASLKQTHNVAILDVTANPETASRFSITSIPYILMLQGGKAYPYTGTRDFKSMKDFVLDGYENSDSFSVPPPQGMFHGITKDLVALKDKLVKMLDRNPAFVAAVFSSGMFFGIFLSMLVVFCSAPSAQVATKQKKATKVE